MKNKESKNQKEEIKNERVLVYVRVRPFSEEELIKDSTTPIEQIDEKNNIMIEKKKFIFDKIFTENSNQNCLFETTGKNVVDSILEGFY